jgi:hypothetical protein
MANIYIAVIGMGACGIFAPWLGASILKKTGESERFWQVQWGQASTVGSGLDNLNILDII